MGAAHELLYETSARLWPALANHLWQATLFAAAVFALTLTLRRAPARTRHALWLLAAAKFAFPAALLAPLAAVFGPGPEWLPRAGANAFVGAPFAERLAEPAAASAQISSQIVTTAAHAAEGHGELFCALTLAWAAGVLALTFRWLVRRREFLSAVRGGREAWAGREFDALSRARARLNLRSDVTLVVASHGAEPGVWRTRRPLVLLPEAVSAHLDDDELEALMLHELAHVERRDNLFTNLQTALAYLFWFYPVVWLVSSRALSERERACDERVLEAGGAADAYATSILKVVRFCFGWRVAGVSGAAAGSNLRRRIEMIMHGNNVRKVSGAQRALLCAAALSGLALTAWAGAAIASKSAAAATGATQGKVVMRERSRGQARAEEPGPAEREIMQAPESAVAYANDGRAPVFISDARMRLITREQLRRADDEGADYYDDEPSQTFLTLPTVTLTNTSGKVVKEVGIGFETNGRVNVVAGHATSIKPGEQHTFESSWNRRNVILPGGVSDVSVRVVWVAFTDGTQWGGIARPPQPPAPPEPAAPPSGSGAKGSATVRVGEATGSAGAGDIAVAGSGSGYGTSASAGYGGATTVGGGGKGAGASTSAGGGASAGGAGLRGQAVSMPNPSYPPIARAAQAQGTVRVRITVDEEGNVISAEAVSGHPLLRGAAVDAARAAKFRPTVVGGKPAKVSGLITYNFVVEDSDKDDEQRR